MTSDRLRDHVIHALEERKGRDIVSLDVSRSSTFTDYMVIASGTSNRHVRALVDEVVDASKAHGLKPLGVEGNADHKWVLLDLGDVVVHVMQTDARQFYDLERLWAPLPGLESTS